MSTPSSSGGSVSSSSSSEASTTSPRPSAHDVAHTLDAPPVVHPDPSRYDDESDVSMSADSEDSEDSQDENDGRLSQPVHTQSSDHGVPHGLKRKLSIGMEASNSTEVSQSENHKKYKTSTIGALDRDKSLLPPEIWHHIFTFVPPKALGCLLRVNKRFNLYLDPSSSIKPPVYVPLSPSAAPVREPDAIWRAARCLYRPGIPKPLEGRSELDMWRLVLSTTCQFCFKKSAGITSSSLRDQWHVGPGADGVRPIWLLGVRCCGRCLLDCTVKEIDLLLSSSMPTPLMSAVPFIFLTTELHVVSPSVLGSGPPPANVSVEKLYLKSGAEDIKNEFIRVKSLGLGTIEEWLKGLEDRGKAHRTDAARWDRFEAMQGIARMRTVDVAELVEIISRRSALPTTYNTQAVSRSVAAPLQFNGQQMRDTQPSLTPQIPGVAAPVSHLSRGGLIAPNNQLPPRPDSAHVFSATSFQPPPGNVRQQRTREEVNELKAARKSEIERRCLLLPEPITPNLLLHMSAFQAALQIIQPFDDHAWGLLLPRLLAQRGEAERREHERLEHTRVIQAQQAELEARRLQAEAHAQAQAEAQAQAQALLQAQAQAHAQAQAQIQLQTQMQAQYPSNMRQEIPEIMKRRLESYADEIIGPKWHGGRSVSGISSPTFAAEVLCHVRQRFYSTIEDDEARSITMTGRGLDTSFRMLTLEHMKSVFDSKVRPITEQYGRDIFLCPECEDTRFYGFEAVIQHYAAKHTEELSLGNIVVNWKAEWPEEPPFKAHPDSKSTSHTLPQSVPRFGQNQTGFSQDLNPSIPQDYPYHPAQTSVHPATSGSNVHLSQTGSLMGTTYGNDRSPMDTSPNAPQSMPQSTGTVRTEEYRARLLDVARDASVVWQAIGSVKEMPGSLRIYVVLYHIVKGFKSRHDEEPTLAMLNDGLSNNKDMRPIRNTNGLACRACNLEAAYKENSHTTQAKGGKPIEKKLLSTPQLWTHFLKTHIDGVEGPSQYNWISDMIELPDMKKIRSLREVKGMTKDMLQLVEEAVPEAFVATPPPVIESPVEYAEPRTVDDNSMYETQVQSEFELPEGQDKHESFYNNPGATASTAEDSRPISNVHQPPQKISNREKRRQLKLNKRKPKNISRDEPGEYAGGYDTRNPPEGYRTNGRRDSRDVNVERRPTYQTNDRHPPPQRNQPPISDDYLEGPRYYNAGASLAELLANPGAAINSANPRSAVVQPPALSALQEAPAARNRYIDEYEPVRGNEPLEPAPSSRTFRPVSEFRQSEEHLQPRRYVEDYQPPRRGFTPMESVRSMPLPLHPQYEPVPHPTRYQPVIYDDYDEDEEVIYVDQHGRRIPPPAHLRRYTPVVPQPRPQSGSPSQYHYHDSLPRQSELRDQPRPAASYEHRAYAPTSSIPYKEDDGYEPVPPQDMYRYEQQSQGISRPFEQSSTRGHERPHSDSYEPFGYSSRDGHQRQATQAPSRQGVSRYEADPRYEPVPHHESQAPRPQHFDYIRAPAGVDDGIGHGISGQHLNVRHAYHEDRRQASGGSDEYDPSNPTMFPPASARGEGSMRRRR